ncbi:hypothetical protein ABB37_08786 [Leptomonas pyrrhocoris]|uniref:Uncharacterized protein n=1 Tax=Leptomonas pyrrhocoris TaxID=157538 RepID=A0A0M9FSM6_LEPPY|nr:hypothetical protein ABB37_08786 [Leptomonas pyrrhocoris]KPA75119.1 hypothetical protein ABB37_08786 [Leptomonas pyrrhocoris]|eukprot:XP_015653558.1 hypothetical protein ABB37_08786 [Leptomonas pyrrhocoris]
MRSILSLSLSLQMLLLQLCAYPNVESEDIPPCSFRIADIKHSLSLPVCGTPARIGTQPNAYTKVNWISMQAHLRIDAGCSQKRKENTGVYRASGLPSPFYSLFSSTT